MLGRPWAEATGISGTYAVEWSDGSVVTLAGLAGSVSSEAVGINDKGQAVGDSYLDGESHAVEWVDGSPIDLGGLAGSTFNEAKGINDAGASLASARSGASNTLSSGTAGDHQSRRAGRLYI